MTCDVIEQYLTQAMWQRVPWFEYVFNVVYESFLSLFFNVVIPFSLSVI